MLFPLCLTVYLDRISLSLYIFSKSDLNICMSSHFNVGGYHSTRVSVSIMCTHVSTHVCSKCICKHMYAHMRVGMNTCIDSTPGQIDRALAETQKLQADVIVLDNIVQQVARIGGSFPGESRQRCAPSSSAALQAVCA